MDANFNSDIAQDSEVVDDEPSVPVSLPDDTHDVSRKASLLDTEKRRRLEEEEDEDEKSGDRHRRKKKKSKDRDRDHRDKDKDRDGRKRDHREKDRERDKDRGGRERSERDREREHDGESKSKRKSKSEDVDQGDVPKSRNAEGASEDRPRASSSSRSSKPSNGSGHTETDPSDEKSAKRDSHRDDKDSRRSDRTGDKEKRTGSREKDTVIKDKDAREDKDGKERRSRRSRSRSPPRRDVDDRDKRDRDRDHSRERNDRRMREKERDRERERARERERDDRNRDRGGGYRRRERSRSRSTERRRTERDKEREDRSDKEKKDKDEGVKRVTLKDILTANPGISIPDAVQRLNVYNTAVALSSGPIDPSVTSAALGSASATSTGSMSMAEFMSGGITVDPSVAAMAAAQAVAALNAQVVSISGPFGVSGEGGALTKPHREVYIGNLPPGVTVSQLADFLNAALKQLGVAKEGGSVVSCWVSGDGHYGFAELRTVEECNAALAYLNGVQIGINLIKVGRPKGYLGPTGMPVSVLAIPPGGLLGGMMNPLTGMMGLPQPPNPMMAGMDMLGGGVIESHCNVVMVSNLPMDITGEQVRELVSPFGELTAFNSIKTSSGTTQSAVFEYADTAAADAAVSGLDKLEIADNKLSVQRVPPHAAALLLQPSSAPPPPRRAPEPPADRLSQLPPTPVIRLSNMTTPAELENDEEYMELQEDVAEECNVYGIVRSVIIPRGGDGQNGEEVGMVYVHFTQAEGAAKAKQAIAGRMFNGNIVKATFFPEHLFVQQVYVLPDGYDVTASVAIGGGDEDVAAVEEAMD